MQIIELKELIDKLIKNLETLAAPNIGLNPYKIQHNIIPTIRRFVEPLKSAEEHPAVIRFTGLEADTKILSTIFSKTYLKVNGEKTASLVVKQTSKEIFDYLDNEEFIKNIEGYTKNLEEHKSPSSKSDAGYKVMKNAFDEFLGLIEQLKSCFATLKEQNHPNKYTY